MALMLTDADTETLRATQKIVQLIGADSTLGVGFGAGKINTQSYRITECITTLLVTLGIYTDTPATKDWAEKTHEVVIRTSVPTHTEPLILTDADTETLHATYKIMTLISDTMLLGSSKFGGGIIYSRARETINAIGMLLLTLEIYAPDPFIRGWAKHTDQVLYH